MTLADRALTSTVVRIRRNHDDWNGLSGRGQVLYRPSPLIPGILNVRDQAASRLRGRLSTVSPPKPSLHSQPVAIRGARASKSPDAGTTGATGRYLRRPVRLS